MKNVMPRRGRPPKGERAASSTERSKETRKRAAARELAYERFSLVVRLEVANQKINHKNGLSDNQARAIASRAIENLRWLDERLADLDAAALKFGIAATESVE